MNTLAAGYVYLQERGLTDETIREMQPIFLTPTPDETELQAYRDYLRESRLTNTGEFRKIVSGVLIPYWTIKEEFRPFGRPRVLEPAQQMVDYYTKHQETVPKFLSPSKHRLKDLPGSHLYLLPHDFEKMGKSKDVFLLTEGEVKAAALSQSARILDDTNNSYVSIGAGGVSMFLGTPEWNNLQVKDRRVYLFFDADSYDKKEVMQAELKLALALLVKGARSVKSCVWSPEEGKGIDDHLVWKRAQDIDPAFALRGLLHKALSPFVKYANPPFAHLQAYQLDSLCAEIAKNAYLKPFQLSMLSKELADAYSEQGIGIKDVRRELERARQHQRDLERQPEDAGKITQEYGIDFTPASLQEFEMSNGQLCFKEHPLCNMFVISKYVYTEDSDKEDTYFLRFKEKSLLLPSGVQANYKGIANVFNRNREILFDGSAKLIQQYISQFWIENQEKIPKVPLYENTGWHADGFFQLPGITKEKNDAVYSADLERRFTPHGERAEQYELTEEMLTQHKAGLIAVVGFVAPCLGLFNLERYTVVIYGGPGSGKTKGCEIAISQYGDPEKLIFSMDSTKVGKEITFSLYRDLPIVLDECNTASSDGIKLAEAAIETIYGFYQGKGRTRANSSITHREVKEFRGLVFMTSERSLESLFSVKKNMRIGGAYRRALEFPVMDEGELWNINPKKESKSQFFARLHNHIRKHYGYVGMDWLIHISDKDVQDRLAYAYDESLNLLVKNGHGNLKGTEKLIALIWAVMTELEIFLQVKENKILKNLRTYLKAITERQQRQIDEQISDETERFQEALENFIALHVTSFDGICPENAIMTQVYGRVEYTDTLAHCYLRSAAFKNFCNEYGFERDTLLPKLEKRNLYRQRNNKAYFQMSIRNTKGPVYWFTLPIDVTEFLHDAKQDSTTLHTDSTDAAPFHPGNGTGGNSVADSTGAKNTRGKTAGKRKADTAKTETEQHTFLREQATATPWK